MSHETPGFFPSLDGTPLYGVWHCEGKTPARPPIVLIPALLDERRTAGAAWVSLARELAANGFPVLRFEFRGEGESLGNGAQRKWPDLLQDIQAALRYAAQRAPENNVTAIGLRLGASLAWQAAHENKPIEGMNWKRLIAIAPIMKGNAQERLWRLRTKIRSEMGGTATQAQSDGEVLDLDGLPVHADFMTAVKALDLTSQPPQFKTTLLQVSFKEEPTADAVALQQAGGGNVALSCLKLEPFWDRLEQIDTAILNRRVLELLGTA
jgi:alpha/beta superfamily hydrolase